VPREHVTGRPLAVGTRERKVLGCVASLQTLAPARRAGRWRGASDDSRATDFHRIIKTTVLASGTFLNPLKTLAGLGNSATVSQPAKYRR
jgi:hypothetical protein